jgi:branched-chain amino acid transport system ATP-binding protein
MNASMLRASLLPPDARRPAPEPLLRLDAVSTSYGAIQALDRLSLEVGPGQLVALVGANGAGKTSLLRLISGLQPASAGRIFYSGFDITRVPAPRRVALGIAQVPEGRQVFGQMTVEDNLMLGGYLRPRGPDLLADRDRMYGLFPVLHDKRRQPAALLSGGQQQMLAIGRALMARPKLLLLDEPSMGLAPLIAAEIFAITQRLREDGLTIFLVEQNAQAALKIADQACVLETGRVVVRGTGLELLENDDVKRAYLGI